MHVDIRAKGMVREEHNIIGLRCNGPLAGSIII